MTSAMAQACRPQVTRAALVASLAVHVAVIGALSFAAVQSRPAAGQYLQILDLRTVTFQRQAAPLAPSAPVRPVIKPAAKPLPPPDQHRPAPRLVAAAPAPAAPVSRPRPRPAAAGAVARPAPGARHSSAPSPVPGGGAGGGGGPVNLGPGVPGGEVAAGGGGTAPGALPGSGSGSGSGTGPGSGQGTGGGHGTVPAPPPPPPPPPPQPERPPEPASPPVKLADRATPEVVRKVAPEYPQECQEEGVQGTVSLLVEVLASGQVGKVSVARSSGDRRLDAAAMAAVRRWHYRPAVQGGIPRTVMTRASVTYSLE